MNFRILNEFWLEKTSKVIRSNKLLKCLKPSIFCQLHVVAAKLNINILKSSGVVGIKMTKYFSLEFGSPDGGVPKYNENITKLCLSRNKEQYNQNFILLLTWTVLAVLLAQPDEVNGAI